MTRCETKIDDGTVYVEDGDGWLEIGSLADLFDEVGGKTYAIEYDEHASEYGDAWLDTDENNQLTIDVRETIEDMTFPPAFVENLRERGDVSSGDASVADRMVYFADVMSDVWDSKGTLDNRDDNPFA